MKYLLYFFYRYIWGCYVFFKKIERRKEKTKRKSRDYCEAFRLKQERKRRKFSLNYIEKNTFISHSRLSRIENNLNIKNEKILTSWDLTRLAEIGLDVQYILFGIIAENALLDEEKELIRHFRGCKNKDLKWYAHAALCADDCNELQKIVNFNNNKNIYNVKIKN